MPGTGQAAGGDQRADSAEPHWLAAAAQRMRAMRQHSPSRDAGRVDDSSHGGQGSRPQGDGVPVAHSTSHGARSECGVHPSGAPVGAPKGLQHPGTGEGLAGSFSVREEWSNPAMHTSGSLGSEGGSHEGGPGGGGDGHRALTHVHTHPIGGVSDAVLRRRAEHAAEAEEERTALGPRPTHWLARLDRATLVHPNRSFRVGWDVALVVVLAYIALVIPFRIAFLPPSDARWMEPLSHAITALFITDMVLNFRTGFIDPESGAVVLDSPRIAGAYLRSWFAVDLVASVPWEWIFGSADVDNEGVSPQLLKVLRLLRLSRLTKLLRLLKVRWGGAACAGQKGAWQRI